MSGEQDDSAALIGRELKGMSQWLDEHRELIGLVV